MARSSGAGRLRQLVEHRAQPLELARVGRKDRATVEQVEHHGDRRSGVEQAEHPGPGGCPDGGGHRLRRDLGADEHAPSLRQRRRHALAHPGGVERRVGASAHGDLVLTLGVDDDQGDAGRLGLEPPTPNRSTPACSSSRRANSSGLVATDGADQADGRPGPCRGDRGIGSLAPAMTLVPRPDHRLAWPGQPVGGDDDIDVDRPDHDHQTSRGGVGSRAHAVGGRPPNHGSCTVAGNGSVGTSSPSGVEPVKQQPGRRVAHLARRLAHRGERAGSRGAAIGTSSKPTMLTSSGTRIPAARQYSNRAEGHQVVGADQRRRALCARRRRGPSRPDRRPCLAVVAGRSTGISSGSSPPRRALRGTRRAAARRSTGPAGHRSPRAVGVPASMTCAATSRAPRRESETIAGSSEPGICSSTSTTGRSWRAPGAARSARSRSRTGRRRRRAAGCCSSCA